jgi:hypothetical protein
LWQTLGFFGMFLFLFFFFNLFLHCHKKNRALLADNTRKGSEVNHVIPWPTSHLGPDSAEDDQELNETIADIDEPAKHQVIIQILLVLIPLLT